MSKKDVLGEFLKLVSSGDVDKAYDAYIHPDFIHHNAYYKGDRESLKRGMKENVEQYPDKRFEILRSLEDGDLAVVHGKVTLSKQKQFGVMHIGRFKGTKIVEMWETGQEMLPDSPNKNGIF